VLDRLGNPDATTLDKVIDEAAGDLQEWLEDRKNRRAIPYRFEQCGYVPVRNPNRTDGLWIVHDKRKVIYARAHLSPQGRVAAARRFTGEGEQ
jgi:hypothetical protein